MSHYAFVFASAAAILNVGMNFLLNRAAMRSTTLLESLYTWHFWAAFVVGLCSFSMVLLLYMQKVELARGMILMSALSLPIGTAIGVLTLRNKLDAIEGSIIGLIFVLLLWRWIQTSATIPTP